MNRNNAVDTTSNSNSNEEASLTNSFPIDEYESEDEFYNEENEEVTPGDDSGDVDQDSDYEREINALKNAILADFDTYTPNTTTVNYKTRQEKFIKWCKEVNNFKDGVLVTENKLLLWLRYVSDRGNKFTKNPLGLESIKMHTKAIIALWKRQRILFPKLASETHPRGATIRMFESTLDKRYHEQSVNMFADTAKNSIQDGYTYEQYIQLSLYYFEKQGGQAAFRDRFAVLCNHSMLLRSESLRGASFQHASLFQFENEGATLDCPVLVLQFLNGKMNQSHRSQYSGAIRHKDVRLCTLGALAFYLFYRFMVEKEEFPDFTSNANWYNIKLLKPVKSNRKNEMSYEAQNQSIHRAFNDLGVLSSHTTHAGRGSGARIAELNEASLDVIRRMGRWDSGSLENSYLTHFSREGIRICNGFPGAIGSFWLPRAGVVPSLQLQEQIFPEIEVWEARLNDPDDEAFNSSMSAKNFLKLMKKLRMILLQDAVLMKKENPRNAMFNHAIFKSNAFLEFEALLLEHIDITPTPAALVLRDIMSIVEQRMNEVVSEMKVFHQATIEAVRQLLPADSSINSTMMLRFQDQLTRIANAVGLNGVNESLVAPSALTATANAAIQNAAVSTTASSSQREAMAIDPVPALEVSAVMLSKNTCTIKELWIEWMVEGSSATKNMTVAQLDEKYGKKWRNQQKDRTFFSRRLRIIKEIQGLMNSGMLLEDALEHCQIELQSLKKKSLHGYYEYLFGKDAAAKKASQGVETPQ